MSSSDSPKKSFWEKAKSLSPNVAQNKKDLWKPKLTDYMNFDHAWSSLNKQIPAHYFENPLDLPMADKIAGLIFIGCGLGIAYLFELERQGI